jgi:hypothetical protein
VRCAASIRHTMSGRFSLRRVGAEGTVTTSKNDSRLNAAHDDETVQECYSHNLSHTAFAMSRTSGS